MKIICTTMNELTTKEIETILSWAQSANSQYPLTEEEFQLVQKLGGNISPLHSAIMTVNRSSIEQAKQLHE